MSNKKSENVETTNKSAQDDHKQTKDEQTQSVLSLKDTVLPALSLFTSLGTLVCCALPALLVTLGMGAALAGFIGSVPWITGFSDYKTQIFIVAFILMAVSSFIHYRARNAPCPADPKKAKACARLRKMNTVVLIFSWLIYVTGFFFAFLAADIFYGS